MTISIFSRNSPKFLHCAAENALHRDCTEIGAEIENEPVRDDIKAAEDHNFGSEFNRNVELKPKNLFSVLLR